MLAKYILLPALQAKHNELFQGALPIGDLTEISQLQNNALLVRAALRAVICDSTSLAKKM